MDQPTSSETPIRTPIRRAARSRAAPALHRCPCSRHGTTASVNSTITPSNCASNCHGATRPAEWLHEFRALASHCFRRALASSFRLSRWWFRPFSDPLMVMFGSPGAGFGLACGFDHLRWPARCWKLIGGWLMLQRKATGWWLLAFGLAVSLLVNLFRVGILGPHRAAADRLRPSAGETQLPRNVSECPPPGCSACCCWLRPLARPAGRWFWSPRQSCCWR